MDYAELQVTTNYSFLRSGSHPHELVERAIELGHTANGIADRNTLAGVVRAFAAARGESKEDPDRIKLLVGCRLETRDHGGGRRPRSDIGGVTLCGKQGGHLAHPRAAGRQQTAGSAGGRSGADEHILVCERHTEKRQGGGEIDTRSAGRGQTLVSERCSTERSIGGTGLEVWVAGSAKT